jgi:hypothetical protein
VYCMNRGSWLVARMHDIDIDIDIEWFVVSARQPSSVIACVVSLVLTRVVFSRTIRVVY